MYLKYFIMFQFGCFKSFLYILIVFIQRVNVYLSTSLCFLVLVFAMCIVCVFIIAARGFLMIYYQCYMQKL